MWQLANDKKNLMLLLQQFHAQIRSKTSGALCRKVSHSSEMQNAARGFKGLNTVQMVRRSLWAGAPKTTRPVRF